jgi:hypothetical protein
MRNKIISTEPRAILGAGDQKSGHVALNKRLRSSAPRRICQTRRDIEHTIGYFGGVDNYG